MERCIICLGSNQNGESHLNSAKESIDAVFGNVKWGNTILTKAEDTACPLPYYNKAASLHTDLSIDQIKVIFKDLEKRHGRTPASKSSGIIPLDIDLLVYGKSILKPDDLKKNYVKLALASIGQTDF